MRLAFVKKRFSLHGGAEQYLKTLLGELKKEGHDLHVFANEWTDEPGFTFHKIGIVQATSFLSVLSFSKNSAKALRRERFDCIVSFERTEYQDIYRAGDGCHRAWLEIRSEVEPSHKRLSFSINPLHRYTLSLEKYIFEKTPLIVVNSAMVKDQIRRYYGTPEGKITVAYNGVDLNKFSPANRKRWRSEMRQNIGIGEHDKVILFVGSGFRRKGLETLIRSLPEVKRSLAGERLAAIVIGKGDSDSFRQTAKRLGVEGEIMFLGPRADVEKFYAAADLFALPTIYDPFSNACLEAMASGLSVITTRNNGAAEVIEEGMEGFITSSVIDHSELARKIVLSLSDAESMGMRARAKAERHSIDKAASEFMDLIKRKAGLSGTVTV
jgi:UDP-glucose:(heptosyl)LPS alpha-1,3-glucosyltransferase